MRTCLDASSSPAPAPSSSSRVSPHAHPFQGSFLERMNFDTSRCCVNHSQEQRGMGECRSRFSLWQLMRLAKRKAKICWHNLGLIQVGSLLAPNHSNHYHYLIKNTQTSASFIILVWAAYKEQLDEFMFNINQTEKPYRKLDMTKSNIIFKHRDITREGMEGYIKKV